MFRIAWGPMRWLLLLGGFAAITMPWRRVYILAEWKDHPGVNAHECVHLAQIDRHGPIWFTILYLWWLARYGYRRNPLEVEAYAKGP
jgi:hypothetical protein